jgi:hypothetical protein
MSIMTTTSPWTLATAGMLAATLTPATAAFQATLPIKRPQQMSWFLKINIITKILEISL